MKIGFYTVYRKDPQHLLLADLMVRSAKHYMPDVPIVQFTDDDTPKVPLVDEVRRAADGPMLERRLEHYADTEAGDWLLVDTDVLFRADVRSVFGQQFGIAVADRNWTHIPPTPDLTAEMPYNTGVVFSRVPWFWSEVLKVWRAFPEEKRRNWLSEQMAFAQVVRDGIAQGDTLMKPRLLVLPGMDYNYPPSGPDDNHGLIAHYKGQRKGWMRKQTLALPTAPIDPLFIDTAERARDERLNLGLEPAPPQPPVRPSAARPLRVFIGYDPRQPVAYHVAAHSLASRSSIPLAITPLVLKTLPITRRGLTEFTYSRFLAPYLCGYEGWSVFLDADMLVLGDIAELMRHVYVRPPSSVHVVKHERKFEQASLMVFENSRCTEITPEYVDNPSTPLMNFPWARGNVGELPKEWNHLVGYDKPKNAKLVHFTMGVPVWAQTQDCEYSNLWRAELQALQFTVDYPELMGHSVHDKHVAAGVLKG